MEGQIRQIVREELHQYEQAQLAAAPRVESLRRLVREELQRMAARLRDLAAHIEKMV